MDKEFWMYFHSIMFSILIIIWSITEVVKGGKDVRHSIKSSESKSNHSVGEMIVSIVIMCVVFFTFLWALFSIVIKIPKVSILLMGIYGSVYVYIAIRQILKMIFVPENRAFSNSDIRDFVYTYMVWGLMVATVNLSQPTVDLITRLLLNNKEIIKVGMLFVWYNFNFLFALGGIYILLYYLWIIGKKLVDKLGFVGKKIRELTDEIYKWWKQGEKYTGLRSFGLWKENKKRIFYKILMTTPLMLLDIVRIAFLWVKIFISMTISFIIVSIFDPIRVLYKYIRKLWNRHNNVEWMYVLAQIAGLCGYIIVFIIIQYGEYEDVTKNVYEFVGTIILIPYFLSKIVSLKKNLKENDDEVKM